MAYDKSINTLLSSLVDKNIEDQTLISTESITITGQENQIRVGPTNKQLTINSSSIRKY